MFKIDTTHVLENPNGTWGFVGSIPVELCDLKPANAQDEMALRAFDYNGERVVAKSKVFKSEQEAREFAGSVGVEVASHRFNLMLNLKAQSGRTYWWTGEEWSQNSAKAKEFETRDDAEAELKKHGNDVEIVDIR